jgi:hypothetical protein
MCKLVIERERERGERERERRKEQLVNLVLGLDRVEL